MAYQILSNTLNNLNRQPASSDFTTFYSRLYAYASWYYSNFKGAINIESYKIQNYWFTNKVYTCKIYIHSKEQMFFKSTLYDILLMFPTD